MAITPEDRIREITATTKRPKTTTPQFTSSVPMTPVNQNVVVQDNSAKSNVDDVKQFAGSDKDIQDLDVVEKGTEAIDAFDVEKYTKDYLAKITEGNYGNHTRRSYS